MLAICSFVGVSGAGGFAAAGRIGSFGPGLPGLAPTYPRDQAGGWWHPAYPHRPPARGACSFPGETEVLLADGTRKPIADVAVGDRVFATDPETGHTEAQPVTDLITGGGFKTMVELTPTADAYPAGLLDPANSTTAAHTVASTVTATDNHPSWNVDESTWTTAANLEPGDHLLTTAAPPSSSLTSPGTPTHSPSTTSRSPRSPRTM